MSSVRIRDITPRLVFQAHPASTSQKIELINRLIAAGIPAIEVSSFVRPDLIPGLADAEQLFSQIDRKAGVSLECCVGNMRGLQRAIDAGAHAAWFLLSADANFAKDNIGRSLEQSLAELKLMAEMASQHEIKLGTYVIFAWGGPSGPRRTPDDLAPIFMRLREIGVEDWILADSAGYAGPPQIRELVSFAAQQTSMENLTVQVHDARGLGIANTAELVALGLRNIDTSLAGAGGHPAMPGAQAGGVSTEDAAQLLRLLDVETGLDIDALIDAANWLEASVGAPSRGFVRHVGAVPTQPPAGVAKTMQFEWRA